MDLKTKLIYQAAKLRLSKIARYGDEVEELQVKQLHRDLLRQVSWTKSGYQLPRVCRASSGTGLRGSQG